MGAVGKDVLLTLYIMSITQVTNRGGIVSPDHSFNSTTKLVDSTLGVRAQSLKRATLRVTS